MSCKLFGDAYGEGGASGRRALTDSEFVSAFEQGNPDPRHFDHEAHIRLAWILINRHGRVKAADLLCAYLSQLDRLQAGGKFNSTLTLAATHLIASRMQAGKPENFRAFLRANPALLTDFKGLLKERET